MLAKLGLGKAMDRYHHLPFILTEFDPAAVPVLVELLRSPESNVRLLAAIALPETGPQGRDALATLRALQDDRDGDVRWVAQATIRAIEESAALRDQDFEP
jgi:HEAT repeat protein